MENHPGKNSLCQQKLFSNNWQIIIVIRLKLFWLHSQQDVQSSGLWNCCKTSNLLPYAEGEKWTLIMNQYRCHQRRQK